MSPTILAWALLGGVVVAAVSVFGKLGIKKSGDPSGKKWNPVPVGIAVLTVGLAPVLARSPGNQSPEVTAGTQHRSEILAKRSMQPVLDHPTARAALKGMNAAQAEAYTSKLAHDGAALFDDSTLSRWAELRRRLAEVSPRLCSAMWKGDINGTLVLDALDALPEPEMRAWAELSARACLLSLDSPGAKPALTVTLDESIREVAGVLPSATGAAFLSDVPNPALSDARACELVKTLFEGAKLLPPARRTAFYRALAAAE